MHLNLKSGLVYCSLLLLLVSPFCHCAVQFTDKSTSDPTQFSLVGTSDVSPLLYDPNEHPLIGKTAELFSADIARVTGKKPAIVQTLKNTDTAIIIGTIGKSKFIDALIDAKKLDVSAIRGDWERFIIQTVEKPLPGLSKALVIAGSDHRGTAYGAFTLSRDMGVSPWYWWADVPVKTKKVLSIQATRYVSKAPSVKYRGIFLNDESPALRNWALEKFGGLNHQFYEKVYELLLRNKANYLWPAMWLPTVFAEDDPLNAVKADEYGIVISTSHHEPMMRAHEEWRRFNGREWNYETNKEQLLDFWRKGVERSKNFDTVITVGMRGDGDEAMSETTAVDLLKSIISDQRQIISEVTGKPAAQTPQVWALYKEVQDYYEKGLRVDDDILVLLSDDNWGNIRFLPKKDKPQHKGGFGMYYHFDYVGAPVSYRWHNVTQIERVWEQMHLSYTWGVNKLWLANVGDIKPMELPVSFFLDYAWDFESITADNLPRYYQRWAAEQFPAHYAQQVAEILKLYTKYNARRTPEMLTPLTYSLVNYREADSVLQEFRQLQARSEALYQQLPRAYRSAFYQLVLSPVTMSANLNEMYVAAGKNARYAEQGRASANDYADKVKELFVKDEKLTHEFHQDLEGGKWNHMMSQTHIGYTHWNHPPANKMPAVSYIHLQQDALLGYEVEQGSEPAWQGFSVEGDGLYSASFPTFDPVNKQSYYLDIFNRGQNMLSYSVEPQDKWIQLTKQSGKIKGDERIEVSVDWSAVPADVNEGHIVIAGAGKTYKVRIPLQNNIPELAGFIENNGVVAMEAANYSRKTQNKKAAALTIANLGRTGSAVTLAPADSERLLLNKDAPLLEYDFTLFSSGDFVVESYVSPTQNYQKNKGLTFAVAVDNKPASIINMHKEDVGVDWQYADWWSKSVGDHIRQYKLNLGTLSAGTHSLKVWLLDPGVVMQKFVIHSGDLKPSYLGPPESLHIKAAQ